MSTCGWLSYMGRVNWVEFIKFSGVELDQNSEKAVHYFGG